VTPAPRLRFTFRKYLQVDAESSLRHEFLDGMIVAIAGGTPDHAALQQYLQIPSLQHIVLVAHDRHTIEVHSRDGERWKVTSYGPGERAELSSLEGVRDVDALYRDPLSA
jgi:hypothetical protein